MQWWKSFLHLIKFIVRYHTIGALLYLHVESIYIYVETLDADGVSPEAKITGECVS